VVRVTGKGKEGLGELGGREFEFLNSFVTFVSFRFVRRHFYFPLVDVCSLSYRPINPKRSSEMPKRRDLNSESRISRRTKNSFDTLNPA